MPGSEGPPGATTLAELTDVTGNPEFGQSPVSDTAGAEFPFTRVTTQDDLDAVLTAVANIEWQPLPLNPGWAPFAGADAAPPRYRLLLNNAVYVEGLVEHLAGPLKQVNQGSPIGKLPVEASPGTTLTLMQPSNGQYPVRVDVQGDGTIVFMGYLGSGAVSNLWTWTTKTTDAATNGQVGIDSADWASASQVNLNEKATNNTDYKNALDSLKAGNVIQLQMKTDAARRALYEVTGAPVDHGTWRLIPVTSLEQSGTLPNGNTEIAVVVGATDASQRATLISLNGMSFSVGANEPVLVRQALAGTFGP